MIQFDYEFFLQMKRQSNFQDCVCGLDCYSNTVTFVIMRGDEIIQTGSLHNDKNRNEDKFYLAAIKLISEHYQGIKIVTEEGLIK